MNKYIKTSARLSSKYVVSHLHGGLGNQLFQYAAAFSLADHIGASVCVNTNGLRNLQNRPYRLDRFNIPEDIYIDNNTSKSAPRKLFKNLFPIVKANRHSTIYREPHYHFSESFFNLNTDVIELFGYFQSEKYFSRVESSIRKIFTLKERPPPQSLDWINRIRNEKVSVSVHVRRGDYLLKPQTHPALSMCFYNRAMNLIKRCFGTKVTFFIFSDDFHYISQKFSNIRNVFLVPSALGSDVQELLMMSQCHHNIIANSSFSWWGAWLNINKDKMVIAPAYWFGPEKMSQRNIMDLFPENWIHLK